MRRGLIVKGRRYYSPRIDEYVVAVRRRRVFSFFRRMNGTVIRLAHRNVCYVSVDDYNLCDELANEAKTTWFFPHFDNATKTEVNLEWENGRKRTKSYRMAIRDLFDGIDSALEFMPVPKEYGNRFRAIVQGMGIYESF